MQTLALDIFDLDADVMDAHVSDLRRLLAELERDERERVGTRGADAVSGAKIIIDSASIMR